MPRILTWRRLSFRLGTATSSESRHDEQFSSSYLTSIPPSAKSHGPYLKAASHSPRLALSPLFSLRDSYLAGPCLNLLPLHRTRCLMAKWTTTYSTTYCLIFGHTPRKGDVKAVRPSHRTPTFCFSHKILAPSKTPPRENEGAGLNMIFPDAF